MNKLRYVFVANLMVDWWNMYEKNLITQCLAVDGIRG